MFKVIKKSHVALPVSMLIDPSRPQTHPFGPEESARPQTELEKRPQRREGKAKGRREGGRVMEDEGGKEVER